MTLKEKQFLFARLMPQLELYMVSQGYHPVRGYAFRDEDTQQKLVDSGASKTLNSNHTRCLAQDIELHDKDGNYLKETEDHRIFGEFWEQLHPLCRWGGRFGDGNHYSIEHEGVI